MGKSFGEKIENHGTKSRPALVWGRVVVSSATPTVQPVDGDQCGEVTEPPMWPQLGEVLHRRVLDGHC